jgi:hypothetical protein
LFESVDGHRFTVGPREERGTAFLYYSKLVVVGLQKNSETHKEGFDLNSSYFIVIIVSKQVDT